MILTTMHGKVKVTNKQRQKSQVHVMYGCIKDGVDVVDFVSAMHSARMKCKHWSINTSTFLLDSSRRNGKTILKHNKVFKSNFQFTYELGKAL